MISSDELFQVQNSYMMLFRCVICLTLIHQARGHAHLEQPPTALSWLEDSVKPFLTPISARCVVIEAWGYGKDWYKQWMFASIWQRISDLGHFCQHLPGSHFLWVGTISETGESLSRQTACYPEALATAFANIVAPLVTHTSSDWQMDDISCVPPRTDISSPPCGQDDGGVLPSNPDWRLGDRVAKDFFGPLRKKWVQRILDTRLDKFLVHFFAQEDHATPPFSDALLAPFRADLEQFLAESNIIPDCSLRAHQPMCLNILRNLREIMQDLDQTLLKSLIDGVGTGFQHDIPWSNCFPFTTS